MPHNKAHHAVICQCSASVCAVFPGSLELSDQAAVIQQASEGQQARLLPDSYHNSLGNDNRATHYGNLIAYPAAHVVVGCSQDAQATYTCTDSLNNRELASTENAGAVVHNFWSTSAVDASTGRPLAALALTAQLQDMVGQIMPVGRP